jgi:hypothetical protein
MGYFYACWHNPHLKNCGKNMLISRLCRKAGIESIDFGETICGVV